MQKLEKVVGVLKLEIKSTF